MKVEATPEQDAMVQAFARAIESAGGKALLVGGLVRDEILGLPSKDFDFEVFGLPMERVQAILSRFGNVKEVGQQFGVLNIQELDWDVALPRREKKTGEGHKGFDVVTDPTMSIEDAARRRDLTINALSKDPLTGEIIDPLNGMADIKAGILRMADPHTFGDDPLRALRVAQFAARFDFEVDPETLKVVAAQPLEQLPGERILPEFSKMLLKGQKPSKGIEVLRQANLLRYFPEIEALQGVPQEPKWHPEGDVYVHTLLVLDEAAKQRTGDPAFDLPLMLGALAHDFGKPMSTEEIDGKITSRGHEEAGIEPTRAFLSKMKAPLALIKQVETLVDTHLRPAVLPGTSGRKGYRKLGRTLGDADVSPELLAALSKADVLGRTTEEAMRRDVSSQDKFLEDYQQHVTSVAAPGGKLVDSVSGKHLIAKGFKPGPDMGKFLALTRAVEDETGITDPDKLIDLAARFLKGRSEEGGSQEEEGENQCGDSHIRPGEECFDGNYREMRKQGKTKSTLAAGLDWSLSRECEDGPEKYPEKCTGPGSAAENPSGPHDAPDNQGDSSRKRTPIPKEWTMRIPNFETEHDEAMRYPHLQGLDKDQWSELAKTGQPAKLSELGDVGNMYGPGGLRYSEPEKAGRFWKSFDAKDIEMPIVIKTPDGDFDLLGGNTRSSGLLSLGIDPDVWVIDTSKIGNTQSELALGVGPSEFFDWTIGRPCEDGPEKYPEKCTGPGSSAENPYGPHDESGLEEIRRLAEEKVKRKPVPPNPKQKAADQIALKRLQEQAKQKKGVETVKRKQDAADQKMLLKEQKSAEMVERKQDAADQKMLLKEQKAADKRDQGADRAGQDLENVGDRAFRDAESLQEREAAKRAKDLQQRDTLQKRDFQKKQKEWMKNESPQALQLQKEKQDAADLKMLTKEEKKAEKETLRQQKAAEKAKNDAAKQAAQLSKEQAAGLKKAEQEYAKFLTNTPKSQVPQGLDFKKFLEYILKGPDEDKATGTGKGPSAFRTNPDKTQPDFLLWEQFEMPADQKGKSLHPGLASVALGDTRPCYPGEEPVEDHCNDSIAPPSSGGSGSLTEHDTLLIHDQARLQHSDSPEEIAGLTAAWNAAKSAIHANPEVMNDPEQAEALALSLATMIDPRNAEGYRKVPVTFGPGKPQALDPELVPRAMGQLFGAYAGQYLEPDEWYHEFEKVHPLEDGNGRLGDLLWKMDHVRRGQPWPGTHPPDFFGTDKSDFTAGLVDMTEGRECGDTEKYPEKCGQAGPSGFEQAEPPEAFSNLDEPDDYLYHVTTVDAAPEIMQSGLVPGAGSQSMGEGGYYQQYSAGKSFLSERDGVSYWTETVENHLFHNYDDPPELTVLKFPKSAVNINIQNDEEGTRDSRTDSYFITEPLSAESRVMANKFTPEWFILAEPQRLHERTNKYPGVKDFDRGSRFSVHPLEGPLGRDGFGGATPALMDELEPRQNGMTPETGIFPDWEGDPAEAYETPNNKDRGFLPVELPFPEMPETSTPHPSPTRSTEESPPSSFPGQIVRKPGGGGLDRAPMIKPRGAPQETGFLPVQNYPDPERNMFKACAQEELLPGGRADGMPDSDFDTKALETGIDIEIWEHGVNKGLAKEVSKDHLVEHPDFYDNHDDADKAAAALNPGKIHGPGGQNPGGDDMNHGERGRGGRGGGTKIRPYWDMDFTGKKSGFMSIEEPEENIYPAATEAARTMEDLMDIDAIFPKDYSPSLEEERPGIGPSMNHRNERHVAPDPIQSDDDANVEQKQVQPLMPNQKMAIAVDPKGPMGERIVIMSPLFEEVSPAIMALRSHRFERHGGIVIDGPPEWLLGITPRLEALDKSSGHEGAADLFSRVQQLIQSAGMPIEYEQQPRP